ncbi:hypothetical protein ACFSQ3_02035 [Sphingobacterium corticis]|uniref:Lipoprotein n=2 Tax=Sphingobacterium corticis TaxID=1812823 RepID=A0ABW5NFS2_9SPHI
MIYKNTYSPLLLLFLFVILIFSSCRTYPFSEYGYTIEKDPNYHNVKSHLSIRTDSQAVVDMQTLHASDKKALKSYKLKPKNVDVLYSATLPQDSSVNMLVWQADENKHDFKNYLPQTSKANRYLYQKKQAGDGQMIHVVYESLTGSQVGLIFSSDTSIDEAKINAFLTKDVRFSREMFPDLTSVDCPPEDQVGWGIDIPSELVRDKHTLLKIYQVNGGEEDLILYTLREPKEFYYTAFSVCKDRTYRAVYTDLQHKEIWSIKKHGYEIVAEDAEIMKAYENR